MTTVGEKSWWHLVHLVDLWLICLISLVASDVGRPCVLAAEPGRNELTSVWTSSELEPANGTVDQPSGRLQLNAVDLSVPAGPISLEVRRSLLAASPKIEGWLGTRWRLNWESILIHAGPLASIQESGRETLFQWKEGDAQYVSFGGDRVWFQKEHAICTRRDGSTLLFDARGRLLQRADRFGNTIKLSYDARSRLSRIDGPYHSFLKFSTDANGRLAEVEGSNGTTVHYIYGPDPGKTPRAATVHYSYGADGSLVRYEHPLSGVTEYRYGKQERVTEIRTNGVVVEGFEFDEATQSLRQTDILGRVTTTRWSQNGRKQEVVDARGEKSSTEHDALGHLVQITGPTGQTVRFKYDSLGRMTSLENAAGQTTRVEYLDETELVAAKIEADGSRREFRYDDRGNPTEIRSGNQTLTQIAYYSDGLLKSKRSLGRPELTYTYDAGGRLASVSDPQGHTSHMEYDARGNLVRVTNALGAATSWTYDSANRISSQTDSIGATTHYQYNSEGRLASVTDPRDGVTKFVYDNFGRLLSATDPAQKVTSYEYDNLGRVRKLSLPDGGTETYRYDAAGNLVENSNSSGAVWKFEYDRGGHLISEFGPLGYKRTTRYDADGRVVQTQDALQRVTAYTYDPQGRLAVIRDAAGNEQRLEYGPDGRVHAAVDSVKRRLALTYDEYGRVSGLSRTAGPLLKLNYQDGRVARVEGPAGGSVSYRFDKSGRRSGQTYANGEQFQFAYNALGQVTEGADGLGRQWKMLYSPRGELVAMTSPTGSRYRYSYNEFCQIENVIDALGHIRHYEYDALGRRIRESDPLGRESEITYGTDSKISTVKLPDGQATQMKYDLLGRLTEIQTPGSPPAQIEYDAVGNIIREKRGEFDASYRYDELDQLVEATFLPAGKTVRYRYDQAGHRSSMEVQGVGRWIYQYDDRDRLTMLMDSQGQNTRFEYDDAGRVVQQSLPNGIIQRRTYDGRGRVLSLWVKNSKGTIFVDRKYQYDRAGTLIRETRERGKQLTYEYDADDRLIAVRGNGTDEEFAYDGVGNRLLKGEQAKYDLADQLERFGDETFSYDAQGRMVTRQLGPRRTEYRYGPNGRLVQVKSNDTVVAEYGYDLQGRRVWKKVDGRATHFVYDGAQILLELDDALAVSRTWTPGPELDRPIGFLQGTSSRYLIADALGSVVAATDQTGAITAEWDYGPLGAIRSDKPNDDPGKKIPYGFTGAVFDAETALYFMRARYYDPGLGRFLTADPVAGKPSNPASLHVYQYAQNNPLRYRDRTGTTSEDIANGVDNISGGIGQTFGQAVGEGVGNVLGAVDAINTDMYRQRDPTFPGLTPAQRSAAAAQLGQMTGAAGNLGGRMLTGIVTEPLRFGTGFGQASVDVQQGHYGSALLNSGIDVLRAIPLAKAATGGGSAALNISRVLQAPAGAPSGPLSLSMRGAFIAEAESEGFQRAANLYAKMHGQTIDWPEFIANVRGASIREMTLGQILRTGGGFAGAPAEGASGWLLSAAEGLGDVPLIGSLLKSQAIRHELMHAIQDTMWQVFQREHELGGLFGRSIYELIPSLLGDPLIKGPLIATTTIPMAGAYFGPQIVDSLENLGMRTGDKSILNKIGQALNGDPSLLTPENSALVPSVNGQPRGGAEQLVSPNFQFSPVDGKPADESKGQVVGNAYFQIPAASSRYPKNSPVVVGFYVKSLADQVVEVPAVLGLTEKAALARLSIVELKGEVETDDKPPEKKELELTVKSQSPGPMTKAMRGSAVALVIYPKFGKPTDSPSGEEGKWYIVRMTTWKKGDPEGRLYWQPQGDDAAKAIVPIGQQYAAEVKKLFGVEGKVSFDAKRNGDIYIVNLTSFADKAAKAIMDEAAKARPADAGMSILGLFGVGGGEPEKIDIRFGPSEAQVKQDGVNLRLRLKSRLNINSEKSGKLDIPIDSQFIGRPE